MPVYGSEMASFAPPPPEMLRLTGVVRGERKIAVLRRGAKRYLVKEGDTVEGSYRVARINGNSVVLKRGTRKQVLRLGG
jgi:type II secretory pathway component PulC